MDYSVVKELGETYLQMGDDPDASDFVKKMISVNQIKGFIRPRLLRVNGVERISYRLSGKESLKSRLKRRKYKEDDIRSLLYAMAAAEEECRRYMLSPEGLVLDEEFIFFNYATESYQFIYRMDIGKENGFKDFTERLIKSPGYFAESAAGLMYGIYEEAGGGIFKACAGMSRDLQDEPLAKEEEALAEPEEEIVTYEDGGRVKDFFLKRFWKKKNADKEPDILRDEIKAGPVIFEPEEKNYETVYVDRTNAVRGELTIKGSGETVRLVKDITAIGKSSEYCDVVIKDESVSRLHAQIAKRGEEFYISDINSKNGVEIDGCFLNPGEEVPVKKGDCIKLGNSELIFN